MGFLAGDGSDVLDSYWKEVAQALGPALALWVAEEEGRILGTVQLAPCQRSNGRHRADVQKLLVHRSARRRGVANALMETLEKHAASIGLQLLVLDTHSGSAAERLYRRLGWEEAGSIQDYAAVRDGTLITTTYFYKRL